MFFCSISILNIVQAETKLDGDTVFFKNFLYNDFQNFVNILKKNRINKVVFENCFGGTVYDGYNIAKEIEFRELDTYFKGRVVSSCALAFMGGKNRYSHKSEYFYNNSLIFHAVRGRQKYSDEELVFLREKLNVDVDKIKNISEVDLNKTTEFLLKYIDLKTNNKFPYSLKENIRTAIKSTDGLVLESRFSLLGESKKIYYCSENQTTQNYSYCPEIKAFSFDDLNIIHKLKK